MGGFSCGRIQLWENLYICKFVSGRNSYVGGFEINSCERESYLRNRCKRYKLQQIVIVRSYLTWFTAESLRLSPFQSSNMLILITPGVLSSTKSILLTYLTDQNVHCLHFVTYSHIHSDHVAPIGFQAFPKCSERQR